MMKKQILILMTFLTSSFAFSQCIINGKSSIKIPDEEVYTVSSETAQCKECHLWVINGDKAIIIGDNKLSAIKIKANSIGSQALSLAMLTPKGIVQCSKNIDILGVEESPVPSSPVNSTGNCKIEVSDFKEGKYSEGIVSIFPNVINDDYKYNWTATYSDNSTMRSTEKISQFPIDKGIISIKLQVSSKSCIKTFSKIYEPGYWKLLDYKK